MKKVYAEGALQQYLAARGSGASAEEMAALKQAVVNNSGIAAPTPARKYRSNMSFSELLLSIGVHSP